MLRIRFIVVIIFSNLTLALASWADSASIAFKDKSVDFHMAYEADGSFPVSFEFTNTGKAPLIINKVFGPGFSNIRYPKDSVLPGHSGTITATINPFGKKGYFMKTINVFSNVHNSPNELKVKGRIVSGTLQGSFKHKIGNLAFRQLQVNFGYVYKGEEVVQYIPVLNSSDSILRVSYRDIPHYINIENKFDFLPPRGSGLIEVSYNTIAIEDWDFVIDKIKLEINGGLKAKGHLMVTANIREDFSILTEEDKNNSPKASIPIKVYNFDTIPSGKTVEVEFPVYNKGSRELSIRTVKPTCGCTAALPEKNTIMPGDSTFIVVSFNSIGFTGLNKKGVTVITNDPINYKNFLWVTGYVE